VVRVGILLLGLLLTLASMAHSLPFGGVFFRLLDGAATTTVPYGSTVSMKGVFANGTGLIKDQDLATTFDPVVSGTTYTTLPLTSSKTYTLTVSNPAGDSVTAHVDVTVTPISVGAITPASASVTVGTTKQFSTTVSGGISNAYTWSVDNFPGGNAAVGTITVGGLYSASATPGSHTISATSTADATKTSTTTVTVVAAPVATSLTTSNATPAYGATFTLTPTYSGGTGAIDQGVTCPATGAESAAISANWTGARTYTLTVTNSAGATETATVTVTPVPFAITTFTPNLPLVTFGGSATLAWTLGGSAPTTLTLDGADMLGNLSRRALVAPRNRQTYTLFGTDGTHTDTKTLKVGAQGLDFLAGNPGGNGNADGMGTAARFYLPSSAAVDAVGNVYVADYENHTIRKITPSGMVSTLAGLAGTSGTADGSGTAARFYWPYGVAADAAGNVYVADTSNNTIRKITPLGEVSTLAGLAGASGSADGTGTAARFSGPYGVAVDAAGNLYVAEANHTIRKITTAGAVSTLAGLAGTSGAANGSGTDARFNNPKGVAVDAAGNVYVADTNNHTIRQITPAGVVSTLAGLAGSSGSTEGAGTAARFNKPAGVAADASGNIYVADNVNQAIRKISPLAEVSTLAGLAGTSGAADGTGTAARFYNPCGVAVDTAGNAYVADRDNHTIRKITSAGVVSTLAGLAAPSGAVDGTGTAALFSSPRGVAVGPAGNTYVADYGNHTIRMINPVGVVTTLAGLAGTSGSANGTGTAARFTNPHGVAVDAAGNAYVADTGNHTIRKITPAGVVSTLAGLVGSAGIANGTGTAAQFHWPRSVALDTVGNVYVADTSNNTIRKITPAGEVSTLAGLAGASGSADGTGTAARFSGPYGVAVDNAGNVYVGDTSNSTIRKISPGGDVSTLAGLAGNPGSTDATGTAARFNGPLGVAVDASGNVYIADHSYSTIRKVTSAGVVTTVAGRAGVMGFQAGPLPGLLTYPEYLALTPDGDLVITMSNGVVQVTAPDAAAPQPSLTVSSSTVARGATFTLTPTFSTGSGAIDQGVGGVSSLEAKTVTADWTGAKTFTLTVAYGDGTSATAPVTVTPLAVSVGYLTPANATVTAGTPTTFSATVTGGNLGTVTWSSTAGSWSGATWTAPASAGGPYTITATSVEDPSKTATTTVTVIAAPVATSLVAFPSAPNQGATFTLTPTYSGGTGSLDNGVTCPATGVASGLLTANWAGARTYTLTVTNAAGTPATATATVTPVPPFAIESFTSNLDLVSFGGSATLSWVLSGPTPTALTLDGASVLGSLSAAVAPRNRQTFTLTGTSGNTDTKTRRVGAQGLDLLAGNPGGYGNADGTGPTARFSSPRSVAVDAAGNTYVADGSNHTIRKISPSGVVSTLAGLAGAFGSIDGTGTEARFNNPRGVAVDAGGNVYVADNSNHTIRKITPAGVVSTLAGLAGTSGNADATGTSAKFNSPWGVAVDAAGNIYVADSNNHTIRKITPAGVVSTLAGLAGTSGTTNGTGSLARFNVPYGVAVDKDGYVYVADRNNHTIRKITISAGVGAVSTLAGQAGTSGFTDGTATAASFFQPSGVAVDADRNIYVVCANTIRKITSSDVVSTFAGWVGTSGSTDATGTAARFNAPSGVAVDASGYVYVADTTNNTIRKITPGGVVNTLAGLAVQQGAADGLGTAAQFYNARGVAVDKDGNAYVGDTSNHTIRKITPAGVVSTLAGLAGTSGSADGAGSLARFSSPWGVAVDATGNVYVADKFNYTIRKITPAGVVTTLAGLAGNPGSADGTGAAAQFFAPLGVAVDTAGNVYVTDSNNHTIRKITPAGEVTTLAGLARNLGNTDATGTSAKFNYPSAVAVDTGGYVYVADQLNYTIRMITPGGVVSTLAGLAGTSGSTDGTGASARFYSPTGVAVDAGGNVYVVDVNNHSIRKVTSAGVVTTVVGRVGVVGFQPGPLPGVLGSPSGVALTPDGDLVIVLSNAVVQVTAP
jgi:mucin-19